MDSTLIGVIVTVLAGGIVFIVWLVRLEGKSNRITDLEKEKVALELQIAEDKKTHEASLLQLQKLFWEHLADRTAHHNAEAFAEFRKGVDEKLSNLDYSIKDVSRKLNHLSGRE